MNILLTDHTGMINTVLWGDHVQSAEHLAQDKVIQITDAYTRSGRFGNIELHLGDRGGLNLMPKDVKQSELDPPTLNITQLQPEMNAVCFKGRIINPPQSREFNREDGSGGRVGSIDVADNTGVCRIVAWGDSVEKITALEENDSIKIVGGSVREGRDGLEIHLSELSQLTILEHEDIDVGDIDPSSSKQQRVPQRKNLSQVKSGDLIELRATLVKMFDRDPTYQACPQCLKKVRPKGDTIECAQHGTVNPIPRMIYTVILDDGYGNIRATLGGDVAEELLQMSAEEANRLGKELGLPEAPILSAKQRLEGEELVVRGRIRTKRDSEDLDLIVYEVQPTSPQDELERLLNATQSEKT